MNFGYSGKFIVRFIVHPATKYKLYVILVSWGTLSDISALSSIWYIYQADVTRGITSRRIASHRIASHRIASRDPSGGPSNAHAPFLDSRLSGFSLRMVGDWPGVTPPYNGFTRPRRVLERKRES